MSVIALSRSIGPIPISVIVAEKHESLIEITANPIETGAEVNDHAYIVAKRVSLDFADKNAAATFAALVRFQESRKPFTLVTGLKVYKNMLIKALSAERDKDTSKILVGTADLQEVIIVDTASSSSGTSSSNAKDSDTAARSSDTVQRSDQPAVSTPSGNGANQTMLHGIFK